MKNVVIIMSSYNGNRRIIPQLDSLFSQKDINIKVLVRDDGSKDNTWEILEQYKKDKQPQNLILIKGENCGWERSFLKALALAPEADYYAFSDQDDIWFEHKLSRSITELEKYDNKIPLLFHCNRISCDTNLKALPLQAPKVAHPLSRENAVTQEYAQGCSIVINKKAKELVCRHFPKIKIPHDFWTGLICYYFGKIIYCDEPLFYHINHGNNASNAGHITASRINRIKSILRKNLYPNVAGDLLEGYSDLIDDNSKSFLFKLKNYKHSFSYRLSLLFNKQFIRVNKAGTILLKIAILLGKI